MFSADGKTATVSYVRGENTEPDISDRPHTIEIWDIPPTPSVGLALVLSIGLTLGLVGLFMRLARWMRRRPGRSDEDAPERTVAGLAACSGPEERV